MNEMLSNRFVQYKHVMFVDHDISVEVSLIDDDNENDL